MPSFYQSAGPLPSSKSLKGFTKEQLQLAYYTTSSSQALQRRPATLEERGENYTDIHLIGKRTTKYLEFHVNKAPLTNRNACKHTQDYVPLPLGDVAVNRALAEVFKGGAKDGPGGSLAPLDGRTMYEDTFQDLPPTECRDRIALARQESAKPKAELTFTICPPGKFMEMRSHEQEKFQRPNASLAKPTKVMLPKQGLSLGGAAIAADVRPKTNFQREFRPEITDMSKRMNAIPSLQSIRADLAASNGLLDAGYFQAKRAPNMSPGQ